MRDVRNDVGILSETVDGLGKLGRTATFAVSAPLATLGSFAVQAASEFDGAMRNINSIAGLTEAELQNLSKEVLAFGSNTRGGATEAANALYTVFSAGLTDTALAMDTMQVATKTAEAGLANMETTTEALVASMLSYGVETMTATRASDALTAMVQVGVGSMENFANSVANALPSAASLGVEIEDLYGSMAFMTQRGFSAAKASTSLNSAMTALVKPTEAMESAMSSLGVRGAEALIEKYGSLGQAIKAVVGTTDGSGEAIAKLFSNVRGKRFVDLLASDFEAFETAMSDFDKLVDGATDRAWQEQMKSFSAQWDLMTSAVEGAAIAIGNVLLPVITPVVRLITEFVNGLSSLNPQILQMGVAFAGVVTVAAPLLWLFATLLNPVGLLLGAVVALGTAFVSSMGDAETAINSLFESIPALGNIQDVFDELYGVIEPPTAEELTPETPTVIPANEFVKIESGDTVWDFFIEDNAGMTWDEFKQAWVAANGTLDLFIGDLVEIPNGQGQVISDEIRQMLEDGASPEQIRAYLAEKEKAQLYTSDFYQMNTDTEGWSVPVETEALQMRQALEDNLMDAVIQGVAAARSFADTHIGAGIDWLAGLFAGSTASGGDTPIYTAVKELLDGDITGAIDALIPTLGTKISTFLGNIFGTGSGDAFPKITKALGDLVTNVGDWLVNEGLPTISRSIGYFAGKVGNLIYEGFGLIGDFISGGGAQKAVGDAGSIVEDSILTPMLDGFSDATSDTDFGTFLSQLFEGLETAWNALDMPMIIQGFEDLTTGVTNGLTSLATADWSGVIKILGFVQKITNWVSGGLLSGAGVAFENIGSAIGNFVTGISELLNGDSNGIVSLAKGILDVGFALIALPVGVFDAIIEGINNLLGIDLPQLGDFVSSIQNTVMAAFGENVEGVNLTALFDPTAMNADAQKIGADTAQAYYDGLETVIAGLSAEPIDIFGGEGVDTFTFSEDVGAATVRDTFARMVDTLSDPTLAGTNMQQVARGFAESIAMHYGDAFEGVDWMSYIENPVDYDTMFAEWIAEANFNDANGVEIPVETTPPEGSAQAAVDNLATEVSNTTPTTSASPQILNQEELAAQGQEGAISLTDALSTGLSEQFLNGELSVDSFNEMFLTPFNNNWVATFGEGSAIQLANQSFMASFTSSTAGVMIAALMTSTSIGLFGATVSSHVTSMANTIVLEVTKAKGAIADLLEELRKMASIATNLQIKVEVSGEMNVPMPSASAAGGWDRVPYDGAITELHKDEMVLPADLANQVRSMATIPSSLTGGGNTNQTNNSNTQNNITIYGGNVDDMLEELERRGVYLT